MRIVAVAIAVRPVRVFLEAGGVGVIVLAVAESEGDLEVGRLR